MGLGKPTQRARRPVVLVLLFALATAATLGAVARTEHGALVMHRREGDPFLQRPIITDIVITTDSVFFCAFAEEGNDRFVAAFDRVTRRFVRPSAGRASRCPPQRVNEYGERPDTTKLADGVLVVRDATRDSTGQQVGAARLHVIDPRFGRRTTLARPFEPRQMKRAVDVLDLGFDTVSTTVAASLVTDSLVWLGLGGGFPEGHGEFGGLHRLDRRTGRNELLTHEFLDASWVVGIGATGPWLWIGTEHPAEYGPYGDRGVLRIDRRTQEWKSLTDSGTPLPDALIRALTSDGRVVAIATNNGLAVVEARPATSGARLSPGEDPAIARWSTAHFVPVFVGDTLRFDVGTRAQFDSAKAHESRYIFVQEYAKPGRERPMFLVVSRTDADSLYRALGDGSEEQIGAALADVSLLPDLIEMFGSGHRRLIGAVALARLGSHAPTTVRAQVRRLFDQAVTGPAGWGTPRTRTALGRALVFSGDSAPTVWARDVLRRRVGAGEGIGHDSTYDAAVDAAKIASAARDRPALPLVISLAPTARGYEAQRGMVEALARYDDPNAWRALVGFARDSLLPRYDVLDALRPSVVRESGLTDDVLALARKTFANGTGSFHAGLGRVAVDLQLMELAPTLVEMLEPWQGKDELHYALNIMALIELTGRADSPMYSAKTPPASVTQHWRQAISGTMDPPTRANRAARAKLANDWFALWEKLHPGP